MKKFYGMMMAGAMASALAMTACSDNGTGSGNGTSNGKKISDFETMNCAGIMDNWLPDSRAAW